MVMKYEQIISSFAYEGRLPCTQNNYTQGDQKVFMHLVIKIQSSGAQTFDHLYTSIYIYIYIYMYVCVYVT
jgi:hypothetical protein